MMMYLDFIFFPNFFVTDLSAALLNLCDNNKKDDIFFYVLIEYVFYSFIVPKLIIQIQNFQLS